jgi:hypothetical protein
MSDLSEKIRLALNSTPRFDLHLWNRRGLRLYRTLLAGSFIYAFFTNQPYLRLVGDSAGGRLQVQLLSRPVFELREEAIKK